MDSLPSPPAPAADALLAQLRARLQVRVPARLSVPGVLLRPSAVLIPVFVREGRLHVVLTERRKDLRSHAGQISFPGGGCDPSDPTPLHTALREAEEEIGLRPSDVDVLGPLDEYPTITRYKISPFVGVVPWPYAWAPQEREVAEVIEAPFAAFAAPGAFSQEQIPVPFLGRYKTVYSYQVGRHRVWGATAAIFKQLLDLVSGLPAWSTAG